MPLTTSIVSDWKFDESSGNAADSVASNTLTNNGTAAFGAAKINNGATLVAATPSYFSIADASQSGLDITGDLSWVGWIKATTLPGSGAYMTLLSKYTSTGNQRSYAFHIFNNAGTQELRATLSSDGTATVEKGSAATGLVTGSFFFVSYVYTAAAGTVDFYLNGSALTQQTGFPNSLFNGTSAFEIGRWSNLGQPFNGVVDEFGIWSRVLTASEIIQLYNGGAGKQYPFLNSNFFMFMPN